MAEIIDITGEIFGGVKVIKEIGKSKVIGECLDCGSLKEYHKSSIKKRKLACYECVKGKSLMVDRVGQVFNSLKVIREIEDGKLICKCIKCGHEDTYNKRSVIYSKNICKHCESRVRNLTGEIYNKLKVIAELGKCKVLCECMDCKHIDEYFKLNLVKEKSLCKKCKSKYRDRTGEVYKKLKILQELGGSKVLCQCIECRKKDTYNKPLVTACKALCKHCDTNYANKSGETFGSLKIIKEFGKNTVLCECSKCKIKDTYIKPQVVRQLVQCKYCGTHKNYKGKSIKNITIMDFAYTGRDTNKYYTCICNKCGEELISTHAEIVKYTCNKG